MTDTIDVLVHDVTDMTLGNDTIICNNSVLELKPNTNWKSYVWSDKSTKNSLLVSDSGAYSVIVTDSNGCSS